MVEPGSVRTARTPGGLTGRRILLPLFMVALCPPWAVAQDADWKMVRQEWKHTVSDGQTFHLSNPWGDVRIRGGEGDRIQVSAVVQSQSEPSVDLVWAGSDSELKATLDFGETEPDGRVDVGIYLPETVAAVIETKDGALHVRGVHAHLDLRTEQGEVEVRTEGSVHIRTQSGAVYTQLKRTDSERASSIETLTGDIRLDLLEGARFSATLETRGLITTDYSIAIERQPGNTLKKGTIDGDGAVIRLKSHRGAIRIGALIVPED